MPEIITGVKTSSLSYLDGVRYLIDNTLLLINRKSPPQQIVNSIRHLSKEMNDFELTLHLTDLEDKYLFYLELKASLVRVSYVKRAFQSAYTRLMFLHHTKDEVSLKL